MNLAIAMRVEYSKAERLLWWSLGFKALVFTTAVLDIALTNRLIDIFTLVAAAISQIVFIALEYFADSHVERADDIRLKAMLKEGLGYSPSSTDLALIRYAVSSADDTGGTSYYSSTLPTGPKHLVDITCESAFYTRAIASRAGAMIFVITAISVGILLFSLTILAQLPRERTHLELWSKIALIAVQLWIADELVRMAIRYRSLASACSRIVVLRDELLTKPSITVEQAFSVLGSYINATAQAPPLPHFIYHRESKRLESSWKVASAG